MKNRDIDILEHIRVYCVDIESTIKRFGSEKLIFDNDRDYRNSVCMSLLQIGELTGHLTEDFRERVWETIITDIPLLHKFCDQVTINLK